MIFGVQKETKDHETRVGLLPYQVKELIEVGSKVIVQKDAGALCGFPDEEYVKAGATIVDTMEEVYKKSDVVMGIKELTEEHLSLLHEGLTIVTCLHTNSHREEVDALLKNKVTGIAWEDISDETGGYPVLKTQSPIAGAGGVLMASFYMSYAGGGPGIIFSKISGCPVPEVTVLGCGYAGIAAARQASGMGANVTVMDINTDKLDAARNSLPSNVIFLLSTKENIERRLSESDLLVNCVPWPKHRTDHLITKEMMDKYHKKDLFVCDVACDVNGALETTIKSTSHSEPLYKLNGVTYYTVDNIPAAYGKSASYTFTPCAFNYIKEMAVKGVKQALIDNPYLRTGLSTFDGKLTLKETGLKQHREFCSPEEALGI